MRCGGRGGGCVRDERRVICVMLRLLIGGVDDCRDAWHQLLRSAARSVVNTSAKDGMGYEWAHVVKSVRP